MKRDNFIRRKQKVRAKIAGTTERPRLAVFRSNKFIYAQVINDEKGVTLVSASSARKDSKKVGTEIAKKALSKKIKKVIFDKSGYKYHGKIKDLADAAREGGLDF